MINVLEPQNERIRLFVDSIYIFRKGSGGLEFTAYPCINVPVALLRQARVDTLEETVYIEQADTINHQAVACNQFFNSIQIHYRQLVDEIAINFKPLGFASFTRSKLEQRKTSPFTDWDSVLPELFSRVLETEDPDQQLAIIEQFLLHQYIALPDETLLLKALELLVTTELRMEEIADISGVHYKQFYRLFSEHVGCSPAHFRKLARFRSSVVSKLKNGGNTRLVDICYAHDYTDQAYFIRQFKALTGKKPALFFKEVTSFGNDKVIFKLA